MRPQWCFGHDQRIDGEAMTLGPTTLAATGPS
jgi:hypothetical protein